MNWIETRRLGSKFRGIVYSGCLLLYIHRLNSHNLSNCNSYRSSRLQHVILLEVGTAFTLPAVLTSTKISNVWHRSVTFFGYKKIPAVVGRRHFKENLKWRDEKGIFSPVKCRTSELLYLCVLWFPSHICMKLDWYYGIYIIEMLIPLIYYTWWLGSFCYLTFWVILLDYG